MNSLFKETSPNSSSVYAASGVEIQKYQLLYFYSKNLIFFFFFFFWFIHQILCIEYENE